MKKPKIPLGEKSTGSRQTMNTSLSKRNLVLSSLQTPVLNQQRQSIFSSIQSNRAG